MTRKQERTIRKRFSISSFFIIFQMIVLLVALLWFVTQKKTITDQPNKASGGNSQICRASNGAEMGMSEALSIARNSACGQQGTFAGLPYCNTSSGTWWMDLDMWTPNLLCSPACVINVVTKTAEINPRCLGANAQDDVSCKRTGCNKEICQDKTVADIVTSCESKPEYGCYTQYASCTVQGNGHCGFSGGDTFTACMTTAKCRWCGNQCGVVNNNDCNTASPSNTQLCLWQDNACRIVEESCGWCGERCERNPPSRSCPKSSTVPDGLSCDPVGTSSHCTINGLPVAPTRSPGYCDDSCEGPSDCVGWLGCYDIGGGIKRCRKPQCIDEHTCFCPNVTVTPVSPSSTQIVKKIIIKVTATPTVTPIAMSTVSVAPTESPVKDQLRVLTQGNLLSSGSHSFVMTGLFAPYSEVNVAIQPDGFSSTVEVDKDGAWKISIPVALSSGEKSATIIATDTLGNRITLNTEFTITGETKAAEKPIVSYVIVFVGAGAVAVAVFFALFLRRL